MVFALRKKLSEDFIDRLNLIVHLLDLRLYFRVARKNLTKFCEGPDDLDIDLYGSLAPQNARKHGHALLGECARKAFWIFPRPSKIANCDLRDSNSIFVSRNIKSSGNRSRFLLTCSLSLLVSTSYRSARSLSKITLTPRMSKTFEAIISSGTSDMDASVVFMTCDQDTSRRTGITWVEIGWSPY